MNYDRKLFLCAFVFVCLYIFYIKTVLPQNDPGKYNNNLPQKHSQEEVTEFFMELKQTREDFAKEKKVIDFSDAKMQMRLLANSWHSSYGRHVEAPMTDSMKYYIDSTIRVLERYQIRMYPKFRSAFAENAKKMLWEVDCEAMVAGDNKDLLILSGSYFLPNENKQQAYEILEKRLKNYRFKRLRFRCYPGDVDYFDYEIDSKKDAEFMDLEEVI